MWCAQVFARCGRLDDDCERFDKNWRLHCEMALAPMTFRLYVPCNLLAPPMHCSLFPESLLWSHRPQAGDASWAHVGLYSDDVGYTGGAVCFLSSTWIMDIHLQCGGQILISDRVEQLSVSRHPMEEEHDKRGRIAP